LSSQITPLQEILFIIFGIILFGVLGFFSLRDFLKADYDDLNEKGVRRMMAWIFALVVVINLVAELFKIMF
jgi:uncharacterized YccA/Bax inhibitor family protein